MNAASHRTAVARSTRRLGTIAASCLIFGLAGCQTTQESPQSSAQAAAQGIRLQQFKIDTAPVPASCRLSSRMVANRMKTPGWTAEIQSPGTAEIPMDIRVTQVTCRADGFRPTTDYLVSDMTEEGKVRSAGSGAAIVLFGFLGGAVAAAAARDDVYAFQPMVTLELEPERFTNEAAANAYRSARRSAMKDNLESWYRIRRHQCGMKAARLDYEDVPGDCKNDISEIEQLMDQTDAG